ncbi:MAG: S8 family serine peptidase [Candidatus Thorarchaeota archaeon]
MANKQFKTTLWVIVIVFLLLSSGAILLLVLYKPSGTGGAGVRIGILDSGLNLDTTFQGHKTSRELKNKVALTRNFATTDYGFDENYTIVDDTVGHHGTVIALQIAGNTLGIAPEAELVIARCVDSEGVAAYEAVLAAFRWIVDEGEVDIVNISLGGEIIKNDTIVEEINKATYEKGVLTVISAGNSGDDTGYALSSINGPADALQAISVGAYDAYGLASYSSIGPLKNHIIKPDLLDTGFSINAIGTSFAAPKIAAKAALLLSWAREQGYQTSPGLLKAALMKSTGTEIVYLEHYGGAGIPNIEEAKQIITIAPKVNNKPMVSFILPRIIPFEINTLFKNDIWSFPLTLISSFEQQFTISNITESGTSIINIPDIVTINQTGIVDCKFIVPSDYTAENHFERIVFESENDNLLSVNVTVQHIIDPVLRIGFDVCFSAWEYDHLLGQFVQMRNYLADEDVALVELTSPDNYSDLSSFDALILADPNSYGAKFNAEEHIETYYIPFTDTVIDSLVEFVNQGNGLFILTTDNSSSALFETNKLLNNFNITAEEISFPKASILSDTNIVSITNLTETHPVMIGIDGFDYYGGTLNITGPYAEAIAWGYADISENEVSLYKWLPVVAAYEAPTLDAGRVLVTGSNFMIDNYGINNEYIATDNFDYLLNVISWITNSTFLLNPTSISSNNLYKTIQYQYLDGVMTTNSAIITLNTQTFEYSLITTNIVLVVEMKRRRHNN